MTSVGYETYLKQCAERDRLRAAESFEERRIANQEREYSGGETPFATYRGIGITSVDGLGGATYRRYSS